VSPTPLAYSRTDLLIVFDQPRKANQQGCATRGQIIMTAKTGRRPCSQSGSFIAR